MKEGEFICEQYLKEQRGWTNSLIKKYLSVPDLTAPNPYCPSGARQIKLYYTPRIRDIEKDSDFRKDFFKASDRSAAHRRDQKPLM